MSYGGPRSLLFGKFYPSRTVEQTVRLNRLKKKKKRWKRRKHILRCEDLISASSSALKGGKPAAVDNRMGVLFREKSPGLNR